MNEKAISLAAENDANDYVLWGNLADSYRWTPELAEKAPDAYRRAIQAGQRHLAINPDNVRVLSLTAVYHAKLGENEQALEKLGRARWLAPADATVGFKSVIIFELTGQRSRALAALKTVLVSGYSIDEIRHEPELAQLRQDPTCQRLLESGSSIPRGKRN
jgi:tetratricopeptide (TPR) repeat protein